jgi:hypothetical protein
MQWVARLLLARGKGVKVGQTAHWDLFPRASEHALKDAAMEIQQRCTARVDLLARCTACRGRRTSAAGELRIKILATCLHLPIRAH